jgi:S1-C subfamily serine protease
MNLNDIVKKTLLLMIIIFSVSCCNSGRHVKINNGASLTGIKDSVFFVFRSDTISTNEESMVVAQSSGTGTTIYSNKNYSDVLTAGHVCIDYFLNFPGIAYDYKLIDFYGNEKQADLIAIDTDSDLCLLRVYTKSVAVRISTSLMISGMSVRYSGYPMGLYMPGNLHHFSGHYSGTDNAGFSMYSLAVTGGSSGSAILNRDGEIVGMISSVTEGFAHLVIGPGIERINQFIFLSSTCEKYCVQN